MKFLAISGSLRAASTNTALLQALRVAAAPDHQVTVFDGLHHLPIFSADYQNPPRVVMAFIHAIASADGVLIASPEYIRAIPGGLKNALDWLASRSEITGKPIARLHASHRGDDMLDQLRVVLGTVSTRFNADLFLRVPLMNQPAVSLQEVLAQPEHSAALRRFANQFARHCLTD